MDLQQYITESTPSVLHFTIPDYMRMVRSGKISLTDYLKNSGLAILFQGAVAGVAFHEVTGVGVLTQTWDSYDKETEKLFQKGGKIEALKRRDRKKWKTASKQIVPYAVRGIMARGVLGIYIFNRFERLRAQFDLAQSVKPVQAPALSRGLTSVPGQTSALIPELTGYSGAMVPAYMVQS
jgi:hypothetical protein